MKKIIFINISSISYNLASVSFSIALDKTLMKRLFYQKTKKPANKKCKLKKLSICTFSICCKIT